MHSRLDVGEEGANKIKKTKKNKKTKKLNHTVIILKSVILS